MASRLPRSRWHVDSLTNRTSCVRSADTGASRQVSSRDRVTDAHRKNVQYVPVADAQHGRMNKLVTVLVAVLALSACYRTKTRTTARGGQERESRQWFTIAGLVPLSSADGGECTNGMASSDSRLSGLDVLINIALSVGGGIAGTQVCKDEAGVVDASCAVGIGTLVPFLIGSRTVTYQCAE